ncbi:ABC transporter ATP-binding protein [Sporichthya sp.]|uniref:ABC transporter ATP-binding protein n=1 Tax=Sporichthya sp. TaxID=65475 RepID=UPI0017B56035|nr:ABC transporter ATP-binding protein [Sporichthya sp.]MBA3741376.1 ABC transporter ATP-binding protein [Sporichthya sp.]
MLALEAVYAGYGGSTVLRGVDLAVPDGSLVALLGANGAGKTTLLRVAAGALHPTSGRLTLDGEDVSRLAPNALVSRGVCPIPEGRGIFPNLTVRENLSLQALDGNDKQALERAVSAFPRLGERLSQMAGTMSGGEQQMLALARTYVQSPRIVLLDEVSMGLAPKVVDEIFEFLDLLRRQGAAMLLVEQYVTRALEVADFVYLLNRGEIAFAGEPSELKDTDVFSQYVGADLGH